MGHLQGKLVIPQKLLFANKVRYKREYGRSATQAGNTPGISTYYSCLQNLNELICYANGADTTDIPLFEFFSSVESSLLVYNCSCILLASLCESQLRNSEQLSVHYYELHSGQEYHIIFQLISKQAERCFASSVGGTDNAREQLWRC